MIKVLHIDTEMTWRGGENQILQLVTGSIAAKDGIEHHIAVRPGSAAEERFRNVCTVVTVSMRGGFSPKAALALARYCRVHSIDLIDAHTSNAHSLALMVKKLVPSLKVVVHRRVDYRPSKNAVNRYKYFSKAIDRYIAISQAIKDILCSYGIPSDRVAVVRSAVSLTKYDQFDRSKEKNTLATTYNLDPSLPFIGNASAFTHQKGYDTLLHAFHNLKTQGVPFHAFLAGDGELMGEMEVLRAKLGLEYDVTFLGFIEDVPRFLSSLDILAVSSRFEGLGTIILEGIGAGLAVCATSVGGIPEMIKNGKTGLLTPVDDANAFAGKLTRLTSDPDLRTNLAKAAKQLVEKEFSLSAMVRGNTNTYRSLLGDRK